MAHAFDTGLAVPTRTAVLTAAINLLSPLKAPAGYLRSVVEFGGVVRSAVDEDGVKLITDVIGGQTPAIAISIGDGVGSPKGDRFNIAEEIELLVYHVNDNMRSLARGRSAIDVVGAASNQADPGLHVAMAHALELLVGQLPSVSPAIKHIRYDRTTDLVTRRDLTIWLQTYQVTTSLTINKNRNVSQLLESIHWRFIREPGEANQPAPKTKPSTLETSVTDLEP